MWRLYPWSRFYQVDLCLKRRHWTYCQVTIIIRISHLISSTHTVAKHKNRTVVSRSFSLTRFLQNTEHGSTQVAWFTAETQQKVCVTIIQFSWELKRQTHLIYAPLTLTRISGTPGIAIFFLPNNCTLNAASFRLDGSEFTHRNVFWKLDTIALASLLSTSRNSKDVWMLPLSSESLCVKTTEHSAAKCTREIRTIFHAALTGHQDKAVQHSAITRLNLLRVPCRLFWLALN